MTCHLPTCFFRKFFGDSVITQLIFDIYEKIQFQFFHNGLTYKDIMDIEILLRTVIKMEFSFAESIIPVDFMNYFTRAMEIEDARKEAIEKSRVGSD